ncbi:50S ribosomal protein L2 [Forsythia ovata]|uniref:50S ribosomal protein L2 n=1 Tax=Forsythia ovata TaxID=205694 RepID=A0ABD1W5X8_9LAMI
MVIHLYKTSTLSTRNGTVDNQIKSNSRNNLIYGHHHCGKGRNARGIITARHRGRGHKRLCRKINFRWNEKDIYGRIVTIESTLIKMHTFVSYTMGMVRRDIFYISDGL